MNIVCIFMRSFLYVLATKVVDPGDVMISEKLLDANYHTKPNQVGRFLLVGVTILMQVVRGPGPIFSFLTMTNEKRVMLLNLLRNPKPYKTVKCTK